jgi:hypothetical protein
MHIFKGFEDQSDTYHDTQTHYLMEQDPSLLQDQAEVMDVVAADKVEALKNERMGPPGPCSSPILDMYSYILSKLLDIPCLGPLWASNK